jgi:hypothetical protein
LFTSGRDRALIVADRKSAASDRQAVEDLDLTGNLAFGFSWLLVMAIGLIPVYDSALPHNPTPSTSALIVFFVAVGSGIVLKRHYSWVGVVMHIFGQIFIWLSIFCISLAAVLYAAG